jgi:hypothetical protein
MTRERTRTSAVRAPAAAAVVSVAVAASLLSGCSHGGTDRSAATKGAGAGAGVARVTPSAEPIVNDPKARPSVSMKDCASTTSGWSAGGTVTNSKDTEATFTIVVSFTTKQSTVLARGETRVTVKAGATKSWTTSANFAKSKGTQCVLRGVAES